MPKDDAEKIVLQIQLQARNNLHEDKIDTLLQSLREALSTCLGKMASLQGMADLPGDAQKFELAASHMLIVTLLPTTFLETLSCLQTWTIHQKQCSVHLKVQCDHYTLERQFPASMHDLPDWLPFYRHLSL